MDIVSRLERQVADALARAGYSGNNTTLVVAASGGPDSSALMYCLDRLREQHRLQLHVAHLNHDFRGEEADEDARFVATMAQGLGLSVTVAKLDPQEYQQQRHISSFEQAARELRYSFLSGVAKDIGAAAVALGHTADDLAETVLIHLLRGTGLHGLRGMTELSPWPWPLASPSDPLSISDGEGVARLGVGQSPLYMFRPLLEVTKADTVAYCRELGRTYREDTGNYMRRFTRNRVRHDLLPWLASEYNPRVREALVRLSRTVALELDYLEEEVARLWPWVATESDEAVSFHRARLAMLHPLLQRLLLRRGYAAIVGDTRRLGETHLKVMVEMIAAPSGHTLDLPLDLRLHSIYHHLVLCQAGNLPCPFPPLEGGCPLTLPTSVGQETVTDFSGWRVTSQLVTPPADLPYSASSLSKGVDLRVSLLTKEGLEGGLAAHFDRDSLGLRVHIRSRQPGDRFQTLGMTQEKKLQDFFTDARVPRTWRDRVPLLVSDRGIAWVVGYRIAEWAKVIPGASAIRIRLSLEK